MISKLSVNARTHFAIISTGICLALLFITSFTSFAQISEKGYPTTYHQLTLKKAVEIPSYNLKSLDIEQLKKEDEEFPSPMRYSSFEDVNIPIKQAGMHTVLADQSGEIWQYKVVSDSAKSIQLFFKKFHLPPGASLFIYNHDYSKIYGAFTDRNNNTDSSLMVADFMDDEVIIEYFEPFKTLFEGQLVLGSIGQAYKNIYQATQSLDANGYIGINCPEGETWQDQKHGVTLISFRIGNSSYVCSGSLINNTENDGTPYFLTANHCVASETVAGSVVAYFNYEQIGCNGETYQPEQTLSGATLLTTGNQSDYTLLLFDNSPPTSYKPFYAGWDITDQEGENFAGIHHPGGEPKKIAFSNSSVSSNNQQIVWVDETISPENSHWIVTYTEGRTNQGSSGSPLLNEEKQIIGQLHGGDAEVDFYGKISHSWANPTTGYNPLETYLDPEDSGVNSIDSYYSDEVTPDPQFLREFNTVCPSTPIRMTGFSAFDPTSWEWSFSPNTVTFHDGTNASSKEPLIAFDEPGEYDIVFTSTNIAGSDSIVLEEAVTASDTLYMQVLPVEADSCACSFDSLTLTSTGASTFMWEVQEELKDFFQIGEKDTNTITVHKADGANLTNITEVGVTLTGAHGDCISTIAYSYPLIAQSNDNIENAIQINSGTNGEFSNTCACVQENEPIPPFTSCTGQMSWCDEFGTGENILGNSVWFYYMPATSNFLSLRSEGFDNQIAIYEADSYEDVLNGDYTLVAANDDYTNSDYDPFIEGFNVEANHTYWIQVDGSAGNVMGDFYLYLENSTLSTGEMAQTSGPFVIYPQPAKDFMTVEFNNFNDSRPVSIAVYDISGVKMYANTFSQLQDSRIELNTSAWDHGIYILRVKNGDKWTSTKIIK